MLSFVRQVRLELTQAKRPLPPQSSVSTISPLPQFYFGIAKIEIFPEIAKKMFIFV